MKYQLYIQPDGLCGGMTEFEATTGDGTPMVKFMRDFDGSEPSHVFEIPPPRDELDGDELPPLSPEQCNILARVVYHAYTAGTIEALNRRDDEDEKKQKKQMGVMDTLKDRLGLRKRKP